MKIGVSYCVFDGIELLEYSIGQIRNSVDYVHVAYQDRSWTGDTVLPADIEKLHALKKVGLIDELANFKNFKVMSVQARSNVHTLKNYERAKRQMGLTSCLKNKCTHFLSMDVDEFYVSSQFENAKKLITDNKHEFTACRFVNYVYLPIYHRGVDVNTVPFICKISEISRMSSDFFIRCDPTRGVNNGGKKSNGYLFNTKDLLMHHMETVRIDLRKKYRSTTRYFLNRLRIDELVRILEKTDGSTVINFDSIIYPALKNVTIHKVDNIFKIPYESWK